MKQRPFRKRPKANTADQTARLHHHSSQSGRKTTVTYLHKKKAAHCQCPSLPKTMIRQNHRDRRTFYKAPLRSRQIHKAARNRHTQRKTLILKYRTKYQTIRIQNILKYRTKYQTIRIQSSLLFRQCPKYRCQSLRKFRQRLKYQKQSLRKLRQCPKLRSQSRLMSL